MAGETPWLDFVTPLPPLATGIAQYSRDLLTAIDSAWPLRLIAESGSDSKAIGGYLPTAEQRRSSGSHGSIVQIGNSGFHRVAFRRASAGSALLVLHDVVLHHGRLTEFVRMNRPAAYRRLMAELYGAAGGRLATEILRGQVPDDLSAYPLSEDLVRKSQLTVVHSEYARSLVQTWVPDAAVQVVPMGIPLPALTQQSEARAQLRLPASAFVIASITHVNPYKRIPVVLRALRRLVGRVPDAILVIAGSVAPSINLRREIHMLNLDRNVIVTGYVSDAEARTIARAADVCVNLRYPSAGETSASLLRLLGAGRPVLVTDDEPMAEYPRAAVMPVPVDRFEDEFLAELLLELASDTELRRSAGQAARAFTEREHSMTRAVIGYAEAIQTAYGTGMPAIIPGNVHEPEMYIDSGTHTHPGDIPLSAAECALGDAALHLRLIDHDATMTRAVRALRDLRIDH